MTAALAEQLQAAVGKAATADPQLLRAYDHDLGEMPRALTAQLRTRPDAVVVARTVEDVSATLRVAAALGVPVTPRGQASSGYGGALCTRGGILLDTTELREILAVDVAGRTVDVRPGAVWEPLARALRKQGLDVLSCPTSAPSSTVGGWFATGGVGIGSLRHGSIRDAVQEIDVVGLDGEVRTVAGRELDLHWQTCGTLGVITRLRLACRPLEAFRSFAVHVATADQLAGLQAAAERELGAYSLSIQSAGYLALRARLEPGHPPPITSGFLALLTVPAWTLPEAVARAPALAGARLLDPALAEHEWEDRYYPMRIKRLGPSLLAGEFLLHADRFAETVAAIERAHARETIGVEAFGVRGGRLAVLVYALEDARRLLYAVGMARAMAPLRIARRRGGAPYTAALWFAGEAPRLFGEERWRAIKAEKQLRDPRGLLNPGKIFRPRLRWLPGVDLSRLLAFGAALASPISRRLVPPAAR
jgi:FAD/FMN-containing dehydrogenase